MQILVARRPTSTSSPVLHAVAKESSQSGHGKRISAPSSRGPQRAPILATPSVVDGSASLLFATLATSIRSASAARSRRERVVAGAEELQHVLAVRCNAACEM